MITDSVLVIVAHPDDEVMGMGGTIARLVEEGHIVRVMYLTGGETSSGYKRMGETGAVAELLGMGAPIHLDFDDQKLDSIPQSDINNIIRDKVQQIKPNIVYTHAREDLNIDHRITHDSVMVACRPTRDCPVQQLYTFCVSAWDFGEFGKFQPNTFVNIQPYVELKMEAMSAYKTELKETPHPMSVDSMMGDDMAKGAKFCMWNLEEFKQVFRLI